MDSAGFLSDDEDSLLEGLQRFLAPESPAVVVHDCEEAVESKFAAEESGDVDIDVAEDEAAASDVADSDSSPSSGDDAGGDDDVGDDDVGDGANGVCPQVGVEGMASVVGIVDSDDSDADALEYAHHGIGPRGRKLRELLAGGVCDGLALPYNKLVERVSEAIPRKAIAFQVRGGVLGRNGARHPASYPNSSSSRSAAHCVENGKEVDVAPCSVAAAEHVEASPQVAPLDSFVLDDAYSCPTAPIALLRSYAMAGRWVSLCAGHIVFEDDSVLYRADTVTPIKCEEHGLVLMSLVSLWLLVALRHRYNECATLPICAKHGATRFPPHCAMDVLDFFLGFREHCDQILPLSELGTVPSPTPSALRRLPARPLVPLRPDELRSQLFWPVNTAGRLGSAKPKSAAMPPPDLNAVAPEAAADGAAKLRRLRAEETALASLVERLTTQLFRTDQELAERAADAQRQRKGYEGELAARAKQRRRGRPSSKAFEDPLAPVFGAVRCTEVM